MNVPKFWTKNAKDTLFLWAGVIKIIVIYETGTIEFVKNELSLTQ